AGGLLQFVDDLAVADMVGDQLALPMAEGMGAGGAHAKAEAGGDLRDGRPEGGNIPSGLVDIAADIGAYLHYGLVHLGLYFVAEYFLPFGDDLLFMAFQFPA